MKLHQCACGYNLNFEDEIKQKCPNCFYQWRKEEKEIKDKKPSHSFIVHIIILLFIPFLARAEVPANTFFFEDGKGYDLSGQQQYFCFQDGKCYTVKGDYAFSRNVGATPVPVIVPLPIQPTPQPTPVPTPVPTPIPVAVQPTPLDPIQDWKFFFKGTAVGGNANGPTLILSSVKPGVKAVLTLSVYPDYLNNPANWQDGKSAPATQVFEPTEGADYIFTLTGLPRDIVDFTTIPYLATIDLTYTTESGQVVTGVYHQIISY